MKRLTGILKTLAASAGIALAAGSASAQFVYADGVPLARGQNCAVQFYEQHGIGPLLVKVAPHLSGSYSIVVYRDNPTGDVLIHSSSAFQRSSNPNRSVLRTQLAYYDTVSRDGMLIAPPVDRDMHFGGPIETQLIVRDERGRVTCVANRIEQRPISAINAPPVPSYGVSNTQRNSNQAARRQFQRSQSDENRRRGIGQRGRGGFHRY